MKKLVEVVRGFLSLTSFLTIIPTRSHDLIIGARHFYLVPLVGLLEGLIAALPATMLEDPWMGAALMLLLSYLITGLNHLDGFADFVDALSSGRTGVKALEIMKQPCRGSIAVASTVLLVVATYASLVVLFKGLVVLIVYSHILAAEAMFILATLSKNPEHEGLGKIFVLEVKRKGKPLLNIAVLLPSLILLFLVASPTEIFVALTAGLPAFLLIVIYTSRAAHRVLGYVSGDIMGFCFELSKTASLMAMSLLVAI